MREMVFRERQEKLAHVEIFAKMAGRILNVDTDKAFGGILAEYAAELFQETYDANLLKQKIDTIRDAQTRIRRKREHDLSMISRLDRMGEFYDEEYGPDLMPKARTTQVVKTRPVK